MGNMNNLIPFNQMSPERQREIARAGGIASGKERRRRAAIKRKFREMMLRHAIEEAQREDLVNIFLHMWGNEQKRHSRHHKKG